MDHAAFYVCIRLLALFMLSSPIVKYLKLILLLTAASIILVGSECLHRWYFNISPLGRPWEEFLYLLTFTSCLCFSRWT